MGPDGLDRVGDLDPPLVELWATGGADRVRDVAGPDRAEQAARGTGPGGQPHFEPGELGGGLLGVVETTNVTGGPGPLDQVNLLLRAPRPAHGQAARDQVIAAVAPGHLDHVTRCPEAGDLLGEDQLHRRATHRMLSPSTFSRTFSQDLLSKALPGRARVRQHRHLTCVLDGRGNVALVLGAVAGYPPGPDLAPIGDELPQQRSVLVVDVGDLLLAEQADFLSWLANRCFRHRGAPWQSPACRGDGD